MTTDAVLWDRIRAGDAEAFGLLYDRHADTVYGFAFRRTASRAVAEDVLQSTFMRAWKALSGGGQEALRAPSARGWLLAIAGRECGNLYRARRRLRSALERYPRPEVEADHAGRVATEVDDERRMSAVRRAVGRLPRHERETLELVVWSGLTIAEAADALGVAEGTVKARLHRARRRLPALLAPHRFAEENS